eukprot:c45448_g1_i1 orf=1-285(-)
MVSKDSPPSLLRHNRKARRRRTTTANHVIISLPSHTYTASTLSQAILSSLCFDRGSPKLGKRRKALSCLLFSHQSFWADFFSLSSQQVPCMRSFC